jgi:hypothetical protein
MRPLLEQKLGYQNPIYLATRKTERRSPILSAFLYEFYLTYRGAIAAKTSGPKTSQNGASRPKKTVRSGALAGENHAIFCPEKQSDPIALAHARAFAIRLHRHEAAFGAFDYVVNFRAHVDHIDDFAGQ